MASFAKSPAAAMLDGISSSLDQLGQRAAGAVNTVKSATAEIESQLQRAVGTAQTRGREIEQAVQEAQEAAATRVDDLLFHLERAAEQGSASSQQLLTVVHQVLDGTVEASAAIGAFGDASILWEGKIRSLRDVLLDVLPTTGQVQAGIQDLVERLRKSEADIGEILGHLRGNMNVHAQHLADLVEAFLHGELSLEEALRHAQEVARQLSGSETGELARLLADGLQGGTFT